MRVGPQGLRRIAQLLLQIPNNKKKLHLKYYKNGINQDAI